MPAIDRFGPYHVFFYRADRGEPPHVHVEREDFMLKVWLHDLTVARNYGFPAREIGIILERIGERRHDYQRAWRKVFG